MQIVDLHRPHHGVLYVGRRMGRRPGSPLGNPFKPTEHGVEVALRLYAEWLDRQIVEGNRQVLRALREITPDSVLACWCVNLEGDAVYADPVKCHAQLVARAVRRMREAATVPTTWPRPAAGPER